MMGLFRTTKRGASAQQNALVVALRSIVGGRHVLTGDGETRHFTTGYRFGSGRVLAVIRPGSLVQFWRALEACAEAKAIIVCQAANTGLTGGSTPNGIYDRDVVLVSTLRIKGVHAIDNGRQVVCLPGTTLHELETFLKQFDREPHSVIGSSCIGASVLGGICNNSGGSLVQRGPAYTELALYAELDREGRLHLVNHLEIDLGSNPEEILHRLENGQFGGSDIVNPPHRWASDHEYCQHVRMVDEATPARFNADPRRLYEASGSAGKIALLAVRLDTFPREERTATFYIGSNSVADLAELRREILQSFASLPIAGEYIHREAFDIADRYGKDTVLAIDALGTSRLPTLFSAKARIDGLMRKLPFVPSNLGDRLLQFGSRLFDDHLPPRLREYRARFEHYLILKMGGVGVDEAREYLATRYPNDDGDCFECTEDEASKAFLHRFAVAGAAVRYRAVHEQTVEDIIALDIALPRNEAQWFETLPPAISAQVIAKLYYGHFFCHVFHQDYIVKKESIRSSWSTVCSTRSTNGAQNILRSTMLGTSTARRALL